MRSLLKFAVLLKVKAFAQAFYSFEITWSGAPSKSPFKEARLGMLLNHTSLFDLLMFGALPISVLWRIAHRGVFPGADITMNRPILGRFIKLLAANVVTITRRRDVSWDHFLESVRKDSLILIAPEGRMKRPDGKDKDGNVMTVRGGIGDLLWGLHSGKMIIALSGGMHHIQAPGQKFPKLFRRIRLRFEAHEIEDYKRAIGEPEHLNRFKLAVAKDLENRRDQYCAQARELRP